MNGHTTAAKKKTQSTGAKKIVDKKTARQTSGIPFLMGAPAAMKAANSQTNPQKADPRARGIKLYLHPKRKKPGRYNGKSRQQSEHPFMQGANRQHQVANDLN